MKPVKVLVVVDLQDCFQEAVANKTLMERCRNLVKEFKDNNDPIIFLEYIGCGQTDPSLLKVVENYSNFFVKGKRQCSGARQVIDTLRKNKIDNPTISVCGCYTSACVFQTTRDLLDYGYKVNVIKPACYGMRLGGRDMDWDYYFNLPNKHQLVLQTRMRLKCA